MHLGPVGSDGLQSQLKEFLVDGVKGHRVQLVAPTDAQPRESILGVICVSGPKAWFFKMKGDSISSTASESDLSHSCIR